MVHIVHMEIHNRSATGVSSMAILFNVFINCILFFVQHISVYNCVDDSTIYVCNSDFDTIIHRLETNSSIHAKWFSENFMKLDKENATL